MVITRQATYPVPNWRLVGPWYRWPRPALPADGRVSRPVIQKFAGDDFIKDFLARPQHSLKYDEVIDVVNSYQLGRGRFVCREGAVHAAADRDRQAGAESTKPMARRSARRRCTAPVWRRPACASSTSRRTTAIIWSPANCTAMSRVSRASPASRSVRPVSSSAAESADLPDGLSAETVTEQAKTVQTMAADLRELLTLDDAGARDPQDSVGLSARELQQQQALRANALRQQALLVEQEHQPSWQALLADKRASSKPNVSACSSGTTSMASRSTSRAGSRPFRTARRAASTANGGGSTAPTRLVADVAAGEQSYPLFAVVPDPREAQHDAAGRTLYYGTVPTGGLQHDANGAARFDDLMTYEIRCFVRQHHPCPPRIGKTPDCHGPLVWSLPSEAFRVAAPFDVLGAANRPITIKMPDLRELAAQAATRPRGKLSPVRFVQPQHLSPKVKDNAVDGGEMGGEAICSFSIPLITIIALFVLSLFLPIVVFIFNLWFLLVFRFCIPPQIKVAAGLDAALAVTPPKVDLDADFSVKIEGLDTLIDADDLHAALTSGGDSMKTRIRERRGPR
jgi:hypothetical protein